MPLRDYAERAPSEWRPPANSPPCSVVLSPESPQAELPVIKLDRAARPRELNGNTSQLAEAPSTSGESHLRRLSNAGHASQRGDELQRSNLVFQVCDLGGQVHRLMRIADGGPTEPVNYSSSGNTHAPGLKTPTGCVTSLFPEEVRPAASHTSSLEALRRSHAQQSRRQPCSR